MAIHASHRGYLLPRVTSVLLLLLLQLTLLLPIPTTASSIASKPLKVGLRTQWECTWHYLEAMEWIASNREYAQHTPPQPPNPSTNTTANNNTNNNDDNNTSMTSPLPTEWDYLTQANKDQVACKAETNQVLWMQQFMQQRFGKQMGAVAEWEIARRTYASKLLYYKSLNTDLCGLIPRGREICMLDDHLRGTTSTLPQCANDKRHQHPIAFVLSLNAQNSKLDALHVTKCMNSLEQLFMIDGGHSAVNPECGDSIQLSDPLRSDIQSWFVGHKYPQTPNMNTAYQGHVHDPALTDTHHTAVTILLIGQIGTPSFDQWHQNIVSLVSSKHVLPRNVEYVFRPHFWPCDRGPQLLQDYAVKVDLKSTEYNVVDDLVFNESIFEQEDFLIADGSDAAAVDEGNKYSNLEYAYEEMSLEGISVAKITDRMVHEVSDKDVAKAWKMSMKHLETMAAKSDRQEALTSTLQELKLWDLEYLGSSVATMIMQAADPLAKLVYWMENRPIAGIEALEYVKTKADQFNKVKEATSQRERARDHQGFSYRSKVAINGRAVPAQLPEHVSQCALAYTRTLRLLDAEICPDHPFASLPNPSLLLVGSTEPGKDESASNDDQDEVSEESHIWDRFRVSLLPPDETTIIYINNVMKYRVKIFDDPIQYIREVERSGHQNLVPFRANIYDMVIFIDPTNFGHVQVAYQLLQVASSERFPVRFGFALVIDKKSDVVEIQQIIAKYVFKMPSEKRAIFIRKALMTLVQFAQSVGMAPDVSMIPDAFSHAFESYSEQYESKQVDDQVNAYHVWYESLELEIGHEPMAAINGIISEGVNAAMAMAFKEQQRFAHKIRSLSLSKEDIQSDKFVLDGMRFLSRSPHRLLKARDSGSLEQQSTLTMLELHRALHNSKSLEVYRKVPYISDSDPSANTFAHSTVWLLVDLGSAEGLSRVRQFLEWYIEDMSTSKHVRFSILHLCSTRCNLISPKGRDVLNSLQEVATAKSAADREALSEIISSIDSYLVETLTRDNTDLEGNALICNDREGLGLELLKHVGVSETDIWNSFSTYGLLAVNGHLISLEKLDSAESFAVVIYEKSRASESVANLLAQVGSKDGERLSEMMMFSGSLLSFLSKACTVEGMNAQSEKRYHFDPFLSFVSSSTKDIVHTVGLHIRADIDLMDEHGPALARTLLVLRNILQAKVEVNLLPRDHLSSAPKFPFYQQVISTKLLELDSEGKARWTKPVALFSALPPDRVLTVTVLPPPAWLVSASAARYDLDNLILEKTSYLERVVYAEYMLDSLLVAGHCIEASGLNLGQPPQGLQFSLSRSINQYSARDAKRKEIESDTVVMRNMGYFQLKASVPSKLSLEIQGRGRDIFDLRNNRSMKFLNLDVDSLLGITQVVIPVYRVPGMDSETLIEETAKIDEVGDSETAESQKHVEGGALSSSKAKLARAWSSFKGQDGKGANMVHVFSLASGHLYERFIRIMMLSASKRTSVPVKFWLLANYMSPTFKAALPDFAKAHGFEYELITYAWPPWLRAQTEKQRVMWAYKILFLDVLFPLNLSRVIFVDSDQVIRSDLLELYTMDIKNAVYAYTPFCDSRKEVEGYRFWKGGYWQNVLQGRSYHISALYLVNLDRLRRVAAGDVLRAQYQRLSADPNSLSNLDQDLPNALNTRGGLAIYSLPQEWLWCESWCSDDTKAAAKTIDLCNNPMTKEPKLKSAKRIIPEWVDLDNEATKGMRVVLQALTKQREQIQSAKRASKQQQTEQQQQQGPGNKVPSELSKDEL